MKILKALSVMALIVAATMVLVPSLPLLASSTDGRIESSAKESYIFKTYLQDDDIKIESVGGVVTLTGTVASGSHKSMAEETVADLPGVLRVNNKLEVKSESSTPYSDFWIGDKVKTTLLFHRSVSAIHTEVDVKEGVVTLRGVASSKAEMDLATEYTKDVDGVKGVNNEMTLSPAPASASASASAAVPAHSERTAGEKIDDASITTQVKLALLFHRSTSAIQTKVKTRDGVVTVRGVADSSAERQLVTKVADDIRGVVKVRNLMTVEKAK